MADQPGFFLFADLPLNLHQLLSAALDFPFRDFVIQMIGLRTFFIGVTKDTQPVKLGGLYKFAEFVEILLGLAWETYDERRPEGQARNSVSHFFNGLQEDPGACAPFHALQH